MKSPRLRKDPPPQKQRLQEVVDLPPGRIIQMELMEPRKLSQAKVARASGLTSQTVSQIITNQRSITPEAAVALAKCFDVSPMFFLNLQAQYDLRMLAELDIKSRATRKNFVLPEKK